MDCLPATNTLSFQAKVSQFREQTFITLTLQEFKQFYFTNGISAQTLKQMDLKKIRS
jgi:hypothetical protein